MLISVFWEESESLQKKFLTIQCMLEVIESTDSDSLSLVFYESNLSKRIFVAELPIRDNAASLE